MQFNSKFFSCLINAGIALAVFNHAAYAQEDSALPETIVTAMRFDEAPQASPVGVTVITAEDIRNSTATTVPELLQHEAGIQVRDSSGSPNQQVDMRGFGIFGDENTLVLLDGQRISENEQATVNWEAIPLSSIDHIEIMRGSGAVLYGGGATGGTINIITKAPQQNHLGGYAGIEAGSYATQNYTAGLNAAGQDVGFVINARHLDTNNYRDNNALRDNNGEAALQWQNGGNKLYAKFGADSQDLQMPGSLSEAQIQADPRQPATPGDDSSMSDGHFNLGGEFRLGAAQFALNVQYREKTSDAAFFVAEPYRDDVHTHMDVWSASPRLRVPYSLGNTNNTLVTGVDWDLWRYNSTTTDYPSFVAGNPISEQRNEAWYVQNTTNFATHTTLTLGGRLHHTYYDVSDPVNVVEDARTRNLNAFEIALKQHLGDAFAVYGKIGKSFRVPNVNDNYDLFTASITMLEPQTSRDHEVGIEYQTAKTYYRTSLYEMDIHNEIHLDPITFNNENFPPTRRQGIELEGDWKLMETLSASANYTYAMAKFRSGTFDGDNVPLVPRNSANVAMTWEFLPATRFNVSARYVGKQYYDDDEANTFGQQMPAYTLVDLKVSKEIASWELSASVKNLLNRKYYSYGVYTGFPTYSAYPEAGINGYVAVKYTFQ